MSDSTSPTHDPGPASGPDGGRGRGRRTGVVVAAAAATAVVLAGGGSFAAWQLMSGGGAQPADALPADTLGLVSLDLDPSGGQKLEALRTLRAFPSLRERDGLGDDDDLVGTLFEQLQREEDLCPDVDYARDLAPWVGQRFALAAVPGAEEPEPVFVVQVDDPDAAAEGAEQLAACAAEEGGDAGDGGEGGYAVGDDYLVAASSDEVARSVLDRAAEEPLSADDDFREWTERAGDRGVLTMYAAPEAGQALLDLVPDDQAEAAGEQLAEFEGAAATLRFDDGGLVLSGAFDAGAGDVTGGSVSDTVSSLPDDSAAVLAFGSSGESRDRVREQLEQVEPGPADDVLGQAEGFFATVGLDFPDDLLTVLGDTFAVSVGGDAPADLSSPADVPAGIRVDGDPEAVQEVISKVEEQTGQSLDAQGVSVETDDDSVALSFGPDYAEQLLGDGALGDDETFQRVVPELSEAQALLFVRFDSSWRDRLLEVAPVDEARGDLEALQALGVSGWSDDGATRFEARLSVER